MNAEFPSLSDVFRLTFAEPVEWLSGEQQRSQPVQWVVTSPGEVQRSDVLLLPAEHASTELLQQAASRQAAAVVLLGPALPGDLEIPPGLPVARVSGRENLASAQRMMLTALINQRAALVERGVRIHTQLSALEAEGAGLEGLAKAMTEICGRGVLIQDKRGGILAACASAELEPVWEQVLETLRPLGSLPEPLLDRKKAGRNAEASYQEVPGGLKRLVMPITVAGMARGYLSLITRQEHLDELDRLVVWHGSMICATDMSRHKAVREMKKRLGGDLLAAILEESLAPRDAALWVQNMGLELDQAHVVLRFAWDGQNTPSRRRLETLVNTEVANLRLRVIVSPMASEVICICQVPPDDSRAGPAVELAKAVIAQGKREYPQVPVRCGVGSPAAEIGSWRISFRQAGQALEMARRLKEDRPLYYPDLSIYRLLLQIEHNPELIAFQEETLGPLLAQENHQELLRTLEAYFKHNGNLTQTAEALYVHRNTLLYRMERIASILNQDLDDPETRLALQLALYIHRMGQPGGRPRQ